MRIRISLLQYSIVTQKYYDFTITVENNLSLSGSFFFFFSGKILQRVGLRRRRSRCSCHNWLWLSCRNYSCHCGCWPFGRHSCRKCYRGHAHRLNKHVNNNSSNREDHNKDEPSAGREDEHLRAEFKTAPRDVCTAGIGVVPSIELRDLM